MTRRRGGWSIRRMRGTASRSGLRESSFAPVWGEGRQSPSRGVPNLSRLDTGGKEHPIADSPVQKMWPRREIFYGTQLQGKRCRRASFAEALLSCRQDFAEPVPFVPGGAAPCDRKE